MNGNKLLDTNILIYLSKGELALDSFSNQKDNLSISVITRNVNDFMGLKGRIKIIDSLKR